MLIKSLEKVNLLSKFRSTFQSGAPVACVCVCVCLLCLFPRFLQKGGTLNFHKLIRPVCGRLLRVEGKSLNSSQVPNATTETDPGTDKSVLPANASGIRHQESMATKYKLPKGKTSVSK